MVDVVVVVGAIEKSDIDHDCDHDYEGELDEDHDEDHDRDYEGYQPFSFQTSRIRR